MRAVRAIVCVAATLAVAACGSTSTKTVTDTVTASSPAAQSTQTSASAPTSSATTPSAPSGPPDCSAVNVHTFSGQCQGSNGSTLTLASMGSSVSLSTMKVKAVSVDTTQSVSSGPGFTANAHGTFVIVTIAVTNTSTSPQTFDEGSSTSQGVLQIGRNTYSVSFDAENTNDPKSFETNNNDIQPGETRTGTIDFDVPSAAASQVRQHGALIVVDFGQTPDQAQAGAILRLS